MFPTRLDFIDEDGAAEAGGGGGAATEAAAMSSREALGFRKNKKNNEMNQNDKRNHFEEFDWTNKREKENDLGKQKKF